MFLKDFSASNQTCLMFKHTGQYNQFKESQYDFNKEEQDRFNIQLERFKNLFGKDMLMINRISKWDGEGYENKIEGSIYQIMDKIVYFINNI